MRALERSVRAGDRIHYLATLFAPASVRSALLALGAYRLELDRIVRTARDPVAAEIRLQWWRDAIADRGFGEGAGVALVVALRAGMQRYGWPQEVLCAVSEARIHDLYADPFADWTAFDGYADESRGALVRMAAMALAVEALGPEAGAAAAAGAAGAAGHAGVALAAADRAPTVAMRLAAGRAVVPVAVWRRETGRELVDDLAAGRATQGAEAAVAALVAHARAADAAMRRELAAVAPQVQAAFLPALTARRHLDAAARVPLAPRSPSPWRLQLALWREARRLRRS